MAGRDLQMEQGKRKGVLFSSHTMAQGKCPSRSPEWVETIGLELPLEELSSYSHGGKGKNHHRTPSYEPSFCPVVLELAEAQAGGPHLT